MKAYDPIVRSIKFWGDVMLYMKNKYPKKYSELETEGAFEFKKFLDLDDRQKNELKSYRECEYNAINNNCNGMTVTPWDLLQIIIVNIRNENENKENQNNMNPNDPNLAMVGQKLQQEAIKDDNDAKLRMQNDENEMKKEDNDAKTQDQERTNEKLYGKSMFARIFDMIQSWFGLSPDASASQSSSSSSAGASTPNAKQTTATNPNANTRRRLFGIGDESAGFDLYQRNDLFVSILTLVCLSIVTYLSLFLTFRTFH